VSICLHVKNTDLLKKDVLQCVIMVSLIKLRLVVDEKGAVRC